MPVQFGMSFTSSTLSNQQTQRNKVQIKAIKQKQHSLNAKLDLVGLNNTPKGCRSCGG
jgi:hypothetical protein